uniref:Meteorin-like protein n=1 Tax=Cacopsylla melanoneura TaxID=428564 RepID=A0A8D9BUQ6_9HEMI
MYLFGVKFKFNLNVFVFLVMCQMDFISGMIKDFGESCDWSGSGLETSHKSHEIKPVYLRCSQGTIKWKYPRGALRIVLRQGTSGKDFHGCLRVAPQFSGARIYLEGHRRLHEIYAPDDGKARDRLRCFDSHQGQIALYVQADLPSEGATSLGEKRMALFSYDLEFSRDDGEEECRPCTDEELITSYCTSDIVYHANMLQLRDQPQLSFTEINIKFKNILRQSLLTSELPIENAISQSYNEEMPKSNSWSFGPDKMLPMEANTTNVYISDKCQVRIGYEDFVFMINNRLGYNIIKCAPRYQQWVDLVRNNEVYKHCILSV